MNAKDLIADRGSIAKDADPTAFHRGSTKLEGGEMHLELQFVMPPNGPRLCGWPLLLGVWCASILAKPPELLPQVVHTLTEVHLHRTPAASARLHMGLQPCCLLSLNFFTLLCTRPSASAATLGKHNLHRVQQFESIQQF